MPHGNQRLFDERARDAQREEAARLAREREDAKKGQAQQQSVPPAKEGPKRKSSLGEQSFLNEPGKRAKLESPKVSAEDSKAEKAKVGEQPKEATLAEWVAQKEFGYSSGGGPSGRTCG